MHANIKSPAAYLNSLIQNKKTAMSINEHGGFL